MSLVVDFAWDNLDVANRFTAFCFAVVHVIDSLTFGLFSKILLAMYLAGFMLFVVAYVRGALYFFKRD